MTPAEKVTMSLYRSVNQTSASRLVSKVAEESPLDPTLEADQPPRKPSVGKPDAGLEDGKPTEPASNGSEPAPATNLDANRKEPAASLANLAEEYEENDKVKQPLESAERNMSVEEDPEPMMEMARPPEKAVSPIKEPKALAKIEPRLTKTTGYQVKISEKGGEASS